MFTVNVALIQNDVDEFNSVIMSLCDYLLLYNVIF